jgi:hypothetical protein
VTADGWTDTDYAAQLCQTAPNSSKAVARSAECHEVLAQCLLQQVFTPHLPHLCFPFSTTASPEAPGGAALWLLRCSERYGCFPARGAGDAGKLGNMILPTTCCVRQVARARKDAEAQTLGQRRCGSLICGSLICLHNSHQDDTKLTCET